MKKSIYGPIAVLTIALLVSACGNGGSTSSSGSSSSSSPAPAPSPSPSPGPTTRYALTVNVSGTGSGTVTSNPAGIANCSGSCTANFDNGTSVTLTVAPAAGSTFTGWSGACTTNPCTLTMSQARSVSATFTTSSATPASYALTVNVNGTGSGTVTSTPAGISGCTGSCAANFTGGTSVALMATPASGSTFAGWSGACTGSSCTVSMSQARTVSATFTTAAPAPIAADFQTRCAQAGVVKCVGFDSAGDFNTGSGGANGAYGFNAGIMPPSGTSDYSRAVQDAGVKASGAGSLRFTIPAVSAADTSGAYFTNFSGDLATQFGANQEFYVQWRQRFSPEFIANQYAGGGGFKQIIVGSGDQPATIYSSCSALELVTMNYLQRGFPAMYNSCTGSASHGAYDGFYEPYGAYDFKLQNARPSPFCLYSQSSSGYFLPNGNCFTYVANEWMTFQMHVQLGPRVNDEFQGSIIELWVAREGRPSELVIRWGPYNVSAGASAQNQRYGKVWLLPYNTGKSASQSYPVAYTWYDELIVSRNRIADPAVDTISVPYALPAPGQAVAIGANTADSIRPAGYSSSAWAYSLFNSYGTGAFVPDYSPAGAFVIAGTGGHTAPANVDAAIFDFSDATWKLRPNANGVPAREADYDISETTGAPYFELLAATTGQVPTPAHVTQTAGYIPSAQGGGPRGSYLLMGGIASTTNPQLASGIHRMDLSTGLWTRVNNDTLSFGTSAAATTLNDPATQRVYLIHDAFNAENSVQYLDLADQRVKRTATFPYPAGWQGPGYQVALFDPVRRLLIAQRYGFPLRALDLNNIAAGWVVLNMAGTQPPQGVTENRWAFYEPDGKFYTRGNDTGQILSVLTPPSGDWKTGAWTYSAVTISGVAMPDHTTTRNPYNVRHFGTFFYIPALRCLAWIAGESSPVILLKPPA